MGEKVDVTFSVMVDYCALEVQDFVNKLKSSKNLTLDVIEYALEKSLYKIREEKKSLYASALVESLNVRVQKDTVSADDVDVDELLGENGTKAGE